ncbi:MAG: hypothetical protein ABW128_06755 [Rhizorhabdus sp.]
MAQQILDLGDAPNDGDGEPLRQGGEKINANFTELYTANDALNEDLAELAARVEYGATGGMAITSFSVSPTVFEKGVPTTIIASYSLTRNPTDQDINGYHLPDPANARGNTYNGVTDTLALTLHVVDANAPAGTQGSDTKSATATALQRRYWGIADAAALVDAEVRGLAGSELSGSRAKSFTAAAGASPGKYVYLAYPASMGDPTSYKINGYNEAPVKTTVTVTTPAGPVSYTVLRSANKLINNPFVEVA